MRAQSLEQGWIIWACDHEGCGQTVEFRRLVGSPDPYGWSEERGQGSELPPVHACPAHAARGWQAAAA